MDQIKVGKFIALKRKEKKITQLELAEMLGITDRAISKWENGNCMPDVGTIPLLCNILDISINDLFSGEKVNMKESLKQAEVNILELKKMNEEANKRLLALEVIIGVMATVILLAAIAIISEFEMPTLTKGLIMTVTTIIFGIGIIACLKIEQKAGFYECKYCHHKYIPTNKQILWAMHVCRTRYMRCPNCNKKSWSKKVVS